MPLDSADRIMQRSLKCASPQPWISSVGLHSEDILSAADRVQRRLMGGLDSITENVETPRKFKGHNFMTCEVLGPATCTQCSERQVKRDQYNVKGLPLFSHSAPDRLQQISADVSLIIKLQKVFPQLTPQQLQLMISRGEVNPTDFNSQLNRLAKRNELIDLTAKITRSTKSHESQKLFFSTIDDLRRKIANGKIPRTSQQNIREKKKTSLMDRLFPPFCSTINLDQLMEKSDNSRLLYAPPLLPVHMQQPEPQFFAGQEDQRSYELPLRASINEEYLRTIERRISIRMTRENTANSIPLRDTTIPK